MTTFLRFAALFLFLAALAPRGGAGAPAPSAPPAADRVAVVELFTSQGCSSCPPADRLLSKIAHDTHYPGKVIPLSFHVDYWNSIGWTDPFSSSRWSQRQSAYAGRVFHTNRIYTPQVVVNGHTECVGNSDRDVAGRIADALATEPAAQISLAVAPPTPDGHLKVNVGAKLAKAVAAGDVDLWVAVYESGLSTDVKAGENASRVLRNDHVVRRMEKAFSLPGTAGAEKSGEIVLGIDKRWKVEDLGVAAFLQDPTTMAIHGAAAREVGR